MPKLDEFTCAYIECALWSESAYIGDDGKHDPDDNQSFQHHNYDVDDIAPEALASIVADCKDFQEVNADMLTKAYDLYYTRDWTVEAQAGHDFWLTRNRHGAGFWDRGLGEIGDALTVAAHSYGESHLYLAGDIDLEAGENGTIYVQ